MLSDTTHVCACAGRRHPPDDPLAIQQIQYLQAVLAEVSRAVGELGAGAGAKVEGPRNSTAPITITSASAGLSPTIFHQSGLHGGVLRMKRLVVLDKGCIVESGTHAELIAYEGLYGRLWQRQTGGFVAAEDVLA